MRRNSLSLISLSVLLSACTSTPSGIALTAESLQHHHWVLEQIDGQPIMAEKGREPDLEIGEQLRANGNAGCNRFMGQVEIQGQQLRISKMATTMMLCPAPQQDWETAMNSTLSNWSEAELSAQQLRLKGSQHELLLRLSDWVH
ncbi:MAG: META domain-containing protein [Pseudomonadaceae bacterium]|jgi:heat shock protein HslJ|nr:META domain-containing protein [Pseudomonadaceae bacterium]